MVAKQDLTQIAPYLYEAAPTVAEWMRVAARVYADDALLDMALEDRAIEQLINTAALPGIVGRALAMPDVHQGYGFPIGGVAATLLPDGAISPGGVGYDINCGVRLLTTGVEAAALRPHMERLMTALFNQVPTGVGKGGEIKLSKRNLGDLLEQGSAWVVAKGYGTPDDLRHTEDEGCMKDARAAAVGSRALERGAPQLGTLGSGNHFLEVDEISEVYDEAAARALGLKVGDACVWIHCGSRGLGHQVCADAVRALQGASAKYGYRLPDRELACAPLSSPEGQTYFQAMCAAANYAWANRQVITQQVRLAWRQALQGALGEADLRVVYDVCHNIAKIETHLVAGKRVKVCVHRKGATRAFGPGRAEVPAAYRALGQPVLIPGDMGSGSYVLLGTDKAMQETFGSTCHGAGRSLSRTQARKGVRGEELRAELESRHITVRAASMSGLAEEAPDAYKDLEAVVRVVDHAGLSRRVARTRPLGVMKG